MKFSYIERGETMGYNLIELNLVITFNWSKFYISKLYGNMLLSNRLF